jgi:hypothetical protein
MAVDGAYTQSHVYSHGDIRAVIQFAIERGPSHRYAQRA